MVVRVRWMIATVIIVPLLAQAKALADTGRVLHGKNGMVVAVSPPGTDVGLAVLKKGGNAVDAAVATGFAMAVTYPAAGNIGGGGFMLIHPPAGKGEPVVIDYREKAPLAANRKMYARGD